jgi:hypothetical protein
MANPNAPMGLQPRRYRNGAPWSGAARHYAVPATDATPLFIGDPVVIVAGSDTSGLPSVTRATAGASNRITGVVIGFRPSATIIANGYRAASTLEYAIVADDPELLFEVQESAATDGAALTAAAMGKNVNLLAGSGSAATKLSGFKIDSTTAATTNTLQLRIIQLQRKADNALGANANWLVAINQPTETGAAGSTGV